MRLIIVRPYLKVLAPQEELQVPLHIHLAETADEVEQICGVSLTPTQLLRNRYWKAVLAAHCVHLTEEDMDILKAYDDMRTTRQQPEAGQRVALCPTY